jgi:hypothetical protein
MTDQFQTLRQSTIAALFTEEYTWIVENKWCLIDNNQTNMILLLDDDRMAFSHLNTIRQWMAQEKAAIAQAEAEANKVTRNPASLSGGYIRQ